MEITIQEMITNLKEKNYTEELLAHKFEVDVRTIQRWANGENSPSPVALKYIQQFYNRVMAR